jgi:hypothetical protein
MRMLYFLNKELDVENGGGLIFFRKQKPAI